jgi:antitoxin (DNA-binding transcriptional repressor) of toxin-antitoxin stability system
MAIKASALRENLYRLLDEVLETGLPIEIERRGKILRIAPAETRSKLDNLRPRPYLLTDPEELVHLDWCEEWRAEVTL